MAPHPNRLNQLLSLLFQAHPWHGVPAHDREGDEFTAYIEIVPTDTVTYELDKAAGHLRLDRPHRYSSMCPTLYGFIPQTYCAERVADRCMVRTGRPAIHGDGDPIDICVLSEKPFSHGNFLLRARPIGGLRMVDGNEADDKIVAVLVDDITFGGIEDISQVPEGLIDRLRHYFLTYKQLPADQPRRVDIAEIYDRAEAVETIRRSIEDYRNHFGDPEIRVDELRQLLGR
jgi:inorganic pyrophosphatase